MKQDFYRLMRDATAMTRSGNLAAATEAIQRALAGGMADAGSNARTPAPGHAANPVNPANAGIVLDGLTRIVPDDEACVPATPVDASARDWAAGSVVDRTTPAATPAPKAVAEHQPERWIDGSFSHRGRSVAYKLFVPATVAGGGSREGRPLVVMLHGCTQNAADFATGTQMNALARAQDALVLYPEQNQKYNPQRCWNWFKPQHQQRDRGEPALLVALTKSIVSDYDADPSRVYVAGLSAGGAMADVLGHCYPDVFAAVGVHSGLPAGAATDVVSALAAMRSGPAGHQSLGPRLVAPTIVFHGDADKTVHERNGAAIVAAAQLKSTTGDTTSVAGQHATRTVYAESGKKSTAEYWQLHGVGHAWSGGSAQGSYTHPGGVDASAEMLRFFMQHRTEP